MKLKVPGTEDPTHAGCHSLRAASTFPALTQCNFPITKAECQETIWLFTHSKDTFKEA
jgi:hypothetical protein